MDVEQAMFPKVADGKRKTERIADLYSALMILIDATFFPETIAGVIFAWHTPIPRAANHWVGHIGPFPRF